MLIHINAADNVGVNPDDWHKYALADIVREDALVRYRAAELSRLLDEVGHISQFDYLLLLKTLDHMELQPKGKLSAVFLAGVRITL